MKTVNIFISSPGDVAPERHKAREVIEQLQHSYGSRLQLRAILWEDLPLGAHASFQEGIDLLLSEKYSIEIALFIVWSRLGSPLGPPLRPDGTAYRSGTEREFEFMLQARTLSGNKHPHILVYTRDDAESFAPMLDPRKSSDALKELISQRDLARQFIRENFQDENDRNIRAYWTYDKPISFAKRLTVHLQGLLDELLGEDQAHSRAIWEAPPYRGLETFDIDHAPIYFGREREECDLELLLRRRAELGNASALVVAASGLGKSSLARAGVAFSLVKRNLDETVKAWRFAEMRPGGASGDLLTALIRSMCEPCALPELSSGGAKSLQAFRDAMAATPETALALKFDGALQAAAHTEGGPVKLLLLIDQMEELWAESEITNEARETFLRALRILAAHGDVWVLGTLRSDVYPVALLSQEFMRLKRPPQEGSDCDGIYELGVPDAVSIHRIIREPAAMAGLRFEKQENTGRTLDQELLNDSLGHSDALPLLEYALDQLFEKRSADGVLTFAAYKELGGVEGALGKRAEQCFMALPSSAQAALGEILPLLVSVDVTDPNKTNRRQARLSDLQASEGSRILTERLVAYRFITTDEVGGVAMAGLAHEALLRRWSRVQSWLAENRELLQIQEHVRTAASDWRHETNRRKENADDLLLAAGLPLSRGERALTAGILDADDSEFVKRSLTREKAAQQRKRRLLQMTALVSSVAALILSIATWQAALKTHEVKRLLAESDVDHADGLFAGNDAAGALWFLSRAVSSGDSDAHAVERLWFALSQRSWPVPIIDPVKIDDEITSALFDPSGTRFAVATRQGGVFLFSANDGKPIGSALPHPREVRSAQFSPDGTQLLTACDDAVSRLWDLRKPTPSLLAMNHHEDEVIAISWNADGSLYATGSRDKQLRVWDPAHADHPVFQVAMKDNVHTVGFDPTNAMHVLCVAKDDIEIWDVKSNTSVFHYQAADNLNGACLSPDGTKVLSFDDQGVVIISDLSKGLQQWAQFTLDAPGRTAAISPNGDVFAIAYGSNIGIYPMKPSQEQFWAQSFSSQVNRLKFTPDGQRLMTACDDGEIQVFDVHTGRSLTEPIVEAGIPLALDFQPIRNRILSARSTRTVRIWSLSPPAPLPIGVVNLGAPPLLIDVTRDARCLANSGHGVSFVLPSSLAFHLQPGTFDFSTELTAAAVLPSGVLVGGAADGRLLALSNGHLSDFGKLNAAVTQLAVSASGTLIAGGADDGELGLWPWPKGASISTGPVHTKRIGALAILEPGSNVVSASWDRVIAWTHGQSGSTDPKRLPLMNDPQMVASDPAKKLAFLGLSNGEIWSVRAGPEEAKVAFHLSDAPSALTFTQDGTMFATGSVSGKLMLWNVRNEAKAWELECGKVPVSSLAFGKSGRWLAVGMGDGNARVYETSTGRAITEWMPHLKGVRQIVFTPDDRYLIIGTLDGLVAIWPLMGDGDVEKTRTIANAVMNEGKTDHRFTPSAETVPSPTETSLRQTIENMSGGGTLTSDEIALLKSYLESDPASHQR